MNSEAGHEHNRPEAASGFIRGSCSSRSAIHSRVERVQAGAQFLVVA